MPAGRPTIGPNIKVALPEDLLDSIDAFAKRQGMTRAASIRHLLETALRIGDADATLDALGSVGMEALFPEAEGPEDYDDLVSSQMDETVLYAECEDDLVPRPMYLNLVTVRGRWVLERVERTGEDWEHHYRVFDNDRAARNGFAEAMIAITGEHWKDEYDHPLWFELSDLEFVYDLARSGAIPAKAIDADGDLYPIDTLIAANAEAIGNLDDIDEVGRVTGLTRGVGRAAIVAAVNRLKAA